MIQVIKDRAILTGRQVREEYPENYSLMMITETHHDSAKMKGFVVYVVDEETEELEAMEKVLNRPEFSEYHYIWLAGSKLISRPTLGDIAYYMN